MKIGKITTANEKGQIVIPQEYRELLGVTPKTNLNIIPYKSGILIQVIDKVIPSVPSEDTYSELLKSTTGAWRDDTDVKGDTNKRNRELSAAKRRREEW